jgi:hypothetical protein
MKILMEEAPASAPGFHNINFSASQERLVKGQGYKDLSTVIVIPTLGRIPARVVQSWMTLMMPMNQKTVRLFVEDMEVGAAYNWAVETILAHPQLSKFKYMLTLEEDNLPPPDGLLKLYESIGRYAAVGGLYWTKGPGGQPMCYGDPKEILNFRPQVPEANTVQECNGLGMGFTLFKIDVFRKVEPPWFVTEQSYTPGQGGKAYTQDLYFFARAREAGLKVACDARVLVGHLETDTGIVW